MSTKRALCAVVVCLLAAVTSPFLHGQATGSFSGTVTDNSGAVVAGAKVTVTAQATNTSREAVTDDTGHYLVPLLGVGDYTLRVEAAGFKASEAKDVRLQIDEQRELDFKLVPASVSSTVEVNATEVAVETTNPTLGEVINSHEVAELPLNGRDFVQLATLTPGVTQETNPNSFFNGGPSSEVSARGTYSLSVGGSRAQSTDWLFDGVDNNELTAGGIAILPSIDAIQEFKVLTYNYSAEWGTRAGPTVLITTKQGSNQWHGSAFEFFRNTKLDAATYDFGTPSAKQQFNLNQFGGTFGGAIQKDKTFFFLDYQAKRQRHGTPFVGLIPTPAMMGGDFTLDPLGLTRGVAQAQYGNQILFPNLTNPYSGAPFYCDNSGNAVTPNPDGSQTTTANPCNKIPIGLAGSGGMADPAGLALIQLYPQSNASNPTLGYNFTNTPVRKLNEGEFDIRLDHNFSSKDSVFARFSYDQAFSFVPGGSPGFAEAGAFASTQQITNHGRNVAVSEQHLFSDKTINQFTAGFSRIFNHILSYGTGTCEAAKIGIQGADLGSACDGITGYSASLNQATKDCVSCGLSSTQLTNYWSVGDRGFSPFQGGSNVFHFSDSLDMIRGKHDIRVGIGIRLNQMNVLTNGFGDGYFLLFGGSGSYTGDDAADLLLGQVGGSIHDQTFLGATTGRRWKMFRPFVQDDWRVTSNLTLNLGVAWSLTTPIKEAQGRQANFNYATGQYLIAGSAPGTSGCTNCVDTNGDVGIAFDKTAIEPRIGFAWKPMGVSNTVVRGGYSIFHDSAWSQGAQGLWQNPPYYAEVDNFNNFPGLPCPFANSLSATPVNCGLQLSFLQSPPSGGLSPILSPPSPDSFTGTIQTQPLNFKQGMVQQFNLNVEHQLPGAVVLTAGYAGSRSSHILNDGLNQNIGAPQACAGGPAAQPGYTLGCGPNGYFAAPYGEFTSVDNNSDNGRARYDSLQIKGEKNAHGLYALLSYTYSRAFDSGFPDGLGTLPGAMYWPLPGASKLDWSLSQINLNNQFTASVLYDLPFGKGKRWGGGWNGVANEVFGNWKVNVIEKAISGFPLFVVASNNGNFSGSGVNFAWNGNSLNRPNEVGNPNQGGPEGGQTNCPAQVHTLSHWFNPCAFADAPFFGELGDAPRAPVYGPRFVNTDFSVIKDFPLGFREGAFVQFRAEFFNLLNHPHFYLPGTSAASMQDVDSPSSFGVVNGTLNDPRFIQLALKVIF
jgi:hypothetical protein